MLIFDLAFWSASFFLFGVFLISIYSNLLFAGILSIVTSAAFLIFKKYYFCVLALAIFIGAFYSQVFYKIYRSDLPEFGQPTEFTGLIQKSEKSGSSQSLKVGKIQITARQFPVFQYGDLVRISGSINPPEENKKDYLAKNGIFGTINFPKIELLKSNQGNLVLSQLFRFKAGIQEIFEKFFPKEKAAFLAGLTLGERGDFTKEFKNKMSLSGTTHLVALSGYNIAVIAWAVALVFGTLFSPGVTFYLSVPIIILFVLMTGAEASVVRAGIMGIIVLLARQSERIYSLRNAITLTAFFMVLINPKVLVFDVGFQLSFLALLGIVYLQPVLKDFFRIRSAGFLSWKENILTTFSAQLAVIPFILGNFGVFSFTSFFANILILEAVPATMGLGFLMAGLGFISDFFAQAISWVVNLLLSYEIGIINLFSRFTLPLKTESFSWIMAIIYYSVLLAAYCLLTRVNGRRKDDG